MGTRFRLALTGAALAVTLAGCLETTSNNYVVYEPGTTQRAKAASKKEAVLAKSNPALSVRADLKNNCVVEHGGLLGGGEKIARQCDCFAAGMVETMGQNDIEFYAQYKVVSTLGVANPADVKKKCGIAVVEGGNRQPPPPGS